MKRFDVCAIGNGIIDIILELSQNEFDTLGLKKDSFGIVSDQEQKNILANFPKSKATLVSGGSVANSIIALTQLGGKAAFTCCLGDDKYGLFYKGEFEALGIEIGNPTRVGGVSGLCLSMVTPDGERTMRTSLGVAGQISGEQIIQQTDTIRDSKWILIEGFLLLNPDSGSSAALKAVQVAKENNCKVAVSMSDQVVVDHAGPVLRDIVAQADLVIANKGEALAFTGMGDIVSAFGALDKIAPSAIVTDGANGVYVRYDNSEFKVDAFECTPLDLTGAGDMLAGAFLYGINHGVAADVSARAACYLAMQVITRYGARLQSGTREYWDSVVLKA